MRFLRVLASVVLVAAVALVAAWQVSASGRGLRSAHSDGALKRELQQFLATERRGHLFPLAPPALRSGPRACFVASGSCSQKPCIVFVQGGLGGVSGAASSSPVGLSLAPPIRPLRLGGQTCPLGSSRPSQTLRVSAVARPLVAVPRP